MTTEGRDEAEGEKEGSRESGGERYTITNGNNTNNGIPRRGRHGNSKGQKQWPCNKQKSEAMYRSNNGGRGQGQGRGCGEAAGEGGNKRGRRTNRAADTKKHSQGGGSWKTERSEPKGLRRWWKRVKQSPERISMIAWWQKRGRRERPFKNKSLREIGREGDLEKERGREKREQKAIRKPRVQKERHGGNLFPPSNLQSS